MTNVTSSAATGAAIRHEALGERFVYLHRTPQASTLSACACPDRRGVLQWVAAGGGTVVNHTDPYLRYTLGELRALYRSALTAEDIRSMPEGSDFVVVLGDFDGNRDRRRAGRRDADGKRTIAELRSAPPPLVASAFASEHAIAAPTFTHELTGWMSHLPDHLRAAHRRRGRPQVKTPRMAPTSTGLALHSIHASEARSPWVPPMWTARKGILLWRGSAGAANHDKCAAHAYARQQGRIA